VSVGTGGVLADEHTRARWLLAGGALAAAAVSAGLALATHAPGGSAPVARSVAPALTTTRRLALSRATGNANRAYWAARSGGGLELRNDGQGIAATVHGGGIAVATSGGLRFTLGPARLGRATGALRDSGLGAARGARSEVTLSGRGIEEWLANGPLAIEQGFTVTARPAGSGALVISQTLGRGLRAHVQDHGQAVVISGRGGTLVYTDLAVRDARGRPLAARLGIAGGALTITVADGHAAYPLHIDPAMVNSTVSQPSAASITYGQSETDTLTVTGSSGTPTGTVTFYECGPTGLRVDLSSCSSTANEVGTPQLLSGSGGSASATSAGFMPPGVGTYCFYAVYGGDGAYNGSSDSTSDGCFTVTPAPLTITASSGSFSYGGTPPTITPAYTPNTPPAVAPTCSTAASAASGVGAYLSTCTGASDPNYTISYQPGLVNVTPAPLTLGVTGSETYGGTPSFKLDGNDNGFKNGDFTSVLSGSLAGCVSSATGAGVGPHPGTITGCTGIGAANYAITYVDDGFTIAPAPLTITASSATMTYGGSVPAITPIYSGLANGDRAPSTAPSCSTIATSSSPAGNGYTTSCIGAADPNYTIGYADGGVTIDPAPLAIYVTGSQTYGSSSQSFKVVGVGGLVNGDTQSGVLSNTNLLSCSSAASASWSVATYYLTIGGCSGPTVSPNYSASYVDDGFAVTPAPLTVEVSGSETYGGTQSFTVVKYDGLVNGDPVSVVSGSLRDCASNNGGTVGSYPDDTISGCDGLAASNYAISYQDDGFTIAPAPLTITADSATMTYGASTPTIGASYAGFVNGDGPGLLGGTLSCGVSGSGPYAVGIHGTSCSGGIASNYTITYVPGTLSVTPAALVITASSGSFTYGGTPPTITPGYSGLKNGDSAPVIAPSCSTAALATSAAGGYLSTCAGARDPDYTITYQPGLVTVTPALLVITASSGSFTYGGAPPTITPGYSGLENHDSAPATPPVCGTAANSASGVGAYASSCNGAVDSNYKISYVSGTVVVNQAPLTVTASSPTMTYGGTVPAITPIYTGLVNHDSGSALPTQPVCTTSATPTTAVADSPVTTSCSGPSSDGNYAVTYVGGAVTVDPAPLTATIDGTQTYGGSNLSYGVESYSGFVNGETGSVVSGAGALSCTTTVGADASVGTYFLTLSACSGLSAANYAISYSYGPFTVTPATLTITATPNSETMTYGGPPPTISAGYSGWAGGDSGPSALTQTPTCYTTAGPTSDAGETLPAICTGALDPNYTIEYVTGTVTVDQAPLTITASSATILYGGTVPPTTASYSGFVNNDSTLNLTTPPTCVPNASSLSPVRVYHPSCSGAVDPNYDISYVAGTLTINPAPLAITVTGTQVYGGTPSFQVTGYNAFVNGETPSVLGGALADCATTVTGTTPAGVYPNTITGCDGLTDANYAISYVDGGFTVTDARTSSVSALTLASIAIGGSESDHVVVTGNVVGGAPTGYVRFYECGVETLGVSPCSSGGTQVGGDVALSAASADTATAASAAFAPDNGPGTYCFRAQYLGDNNYNTSADGSADECFTVTAGSTTASAAPAAASAPIGTAVADTITVTGNAVAGPPSGAVSFYACAPGSMPCTSGGTSLGNADLAAAGGDTATATSSSFLATSGPGTYCFRAVYGGDANYSGSSDASADQCFTVTTGPSATVSSVTYGTIAAGQSDADTVTVTGNAGGGAPTGSVSFYVCGPGASGCSSTASQLGSAVTLAVNGGQTATATSSYFTANTAGSYCFYAVYSGNSNYAGSSDAGADGCFTANATAASTPAPSTASVTAPSPASVTAPSTAFQIAGHSFNAKHETIHMTLTLPGAGTIGLVATHGRGKVGSGSSSALASGKLKVALALSAQGVHELAKARKDHKPFKLAVHVTFTPNGGSPSSQTLTLTLGG
jgi:hypothetical protein